MATIVELDGVRPTVGADVWLAPTAVLIGDVHVGDRASIWFGAVLRGDASRITVGERTSIQDNCVIHCADALPTEIGSDVVVGHGSLLEGCVIEDGAVVGMGSIVLQRARVGAKAVLGAGAVLSERREVGPGMLAAGVPAAEKKPLSGSAQRWTETAAVEYQRYRERYLAGARVV